MSDLQLRSVAKHYGSVRAVADVTLTVAAGSRTAIVGPSGSGKTTLLRLIAGFEAPDTGAIVLGGATLAHGPGAMVPAHRRRIGYVPQDGALFPHLTVAANIGFGVTGPAPERAQRVAELAEMVGLDRRMLGSWPHELSGGQQQRVALARALAQQPRLMLLDEPFSALDAGLRTATRKATAQLLAAAGVTAVLVTHDQAEALSFADQIAVMRDGSLAQVGRPMDLYLRPRDEDTATFLGDAVIVSARVERGWAECHLGRIAVDDAERHGTARIMLRPEQLRVAEAPAGAPERGTGVVTDVDFTGHACVLTLQVAGAGAFAAPGETPAPLMVRTTAQSALPVGARVSITVTGPAHVLVNPA